MNYIDVGLPHTEFSPTKKHFTPPRNIPMCGLSRRYLGLDPLTRGEVAELTNRLSQPKKEPKPELIKKHKKHTHGHGIKGTGRFTGKKRMSHSQIDKMVARLCGNKGKEEKDSKQDKNKKTNEEHENEKENLEEDVEEVDDVPDRRESTAPADNVNKIQRRYSKLKQRYEMGITRPPNRQNSIFESGPRSNKYRENENDFASEGKLSSPRLKNMAHDDDVTKESKERRNELQRCNSSFGNAVPRTGTAVVRKEDVVEDFIQRWNTWEIS